MSQDFKPFHIFNAGCAAVLIHMQHLPDVVVNPSLDSWALWKRDTIIKHYYWPMKFSDVALIFRTLYVMTENESGKLEHMKIVGL